MKILFLNYAYSSQVKTNANSICLQKILEQISSEYECSILTNQNYCQKVEIQIREDRNALVYHVNSIDSNNKRNWVGKAETYYLDNLKSEKFDFIISISNSFDTVILGQKIQKITPKTKWIIYQLDPYAFENNLIFLKKQVKKQIEHKMFKSADNILLSSELFKQYNINEYKKYNSKFIDFGIPLLENLNYLQKQSWNNEEVNCVYVGSFYDKIRSPELMLSVFSKVVQKNPKVKLHLYSNGCEEIVSNYQLNYLKDNLVVHEHKSHQEILEILGKSDFLVNIGNTVANQVPSKVFEYISIGKPIINFMQITEDTSAEYLKWYDLAINLKKSEDLEIQSKKLEKFIYDTYNKTLNFEYLDKHLLKYSLEQIVLQLKNVISDKE